ncbi:MAG: hypothetical protein WBB31_02215 [Saprospiraceae bacterium]
MNNKFLIGGIIGGVVFFLLGWLIYGMLLMSTMEGSMMAGLNKPMEEFNWLFLGLGQLASGFLLAYVLTKSGTSGFGGGATVGAVLGFLMVASFDLSLWGTSNYFTSLNAVLIDMAAGTVMVAITGGVIGLYLGSGKKTA